MPLGKTAPEVGKAAPATGPRVIMQMEKVKGLTYAPTPDYPKEAIQKHWGGFGLFEVQCRRNGEVWVVYVTLSTGHKVLDDAAVATLRQWRSWKGYKRVVFAVPITFDPGTSSKPVHKP